MGVEGDEQVGPAGEFAPVIRLVIIPPPTPLVEGELGSGCINDEIVDVDGEAAVAVGIKDCVPPTIKECCGL